MILTTDERLFVDKAGREFAVSAGWLGESAEDLRILIDMEVCLGETNAALVVDALAVYQARRPTSAQDRWEKKRRRPPAYCGWCAVICAYCERTLTEIERSETRANRRCYVAEAAAAAIVRRHLPDCETLTQWLALAS